MAVMSDETPLVLKCTTAPGQLERAHLEIDLYSSGELHGLAPTLAASAFAGGWAAIATSQCTPLPSLDRISPDTRMEVCASLADIHGRTPRNQNLKPRQRVQDSTKHQDFAPWRDLNSGEIVMQGVELLREPRPWLTPPGLQHGDAHVENVLRAYDGRIVWVDWHEANLGDGVSDLVFCWQRAEFAGGNPPREAMTAAYARARKLDPRALRTAIAWAELQLLVHSWPPFLQYGTPQAREFMRTRLEALVTELAD